MSIILSSQNVHTEDGLNVLGDFGKAIGIPGLPRPEGRDSKGTNGLEIVKGKVNDVLNKLLGNTNQESWDYNFVGSGKQNIAGGNVQGGKVAPLEDASVRQVYSQTPQASVIIKKRAFSSLKNLYNPIYMDPGEQWLLRATKRLISNKCSEIANYEKLTKILKLDELGASPSVIFASLISTVAADSGGSDWFTSAMSLKKAAYDRQPPKITTYFMDYDMPVIDKLGPGNGVFEITMVSDISTNLGLDGSGNCNFSIEDPYRLFFVRENDIETALQQTSLSSFVSAISSAASLALDSSQTNDSLLNQSRKSRGKSEISFTISVGSGPDVVAIIDAIGFQITADNLDDVPENHVLNDDEQSLFKSVLENLETYQSAMKSNLLNGLGGVNAKNIRGDVEYARKKMRLFYLGKSIVQPMDAVHILIDGGTRRSGEGEDLARTSKDLGTLSGWGNVFGSMLNDDSGIDDDLLEIEWRREGQHMRFSDFKKLRLMQPSGESGLHVFGGLVKTVSDRYDANSGKFTLSVNCDSNMEWLKISKYNQQPSLDQTQGNIYDPLTPFNYKTDPATGLPIGKPELSDINKVQGIVKKFFNNGPRIGTPLVTIADMEQDVRKVGGNILTLYQHAPGLLYKWKEGIQTAVYNLSGVNPLDGTLVDGKQLRRDVGQFASNTPFDNLDSANIISLLVTGFPYDPARFLQSALNNGSFNIEAGLNSTKNYFHTFLDVQRTQSFVHGGFVPFKTLSGSPAALMTLVKTQKQLTDKSTRLSQLRTSQATLSDKMNQMEYMKLENTPLKTALQNKIKKISSDLDILENEILGLTSSPKWLDGGVLEVAGNDISFDLVGAGSDYKLASDKLTHATLRRREQIVNATDSNLLIISDEYDKDYDIQAFVLKLREQTADLWKSNYMSVFQTCENVAKTLNFEFFCSTQGHIVFRPPQYNRTPSSVFNQMISLSKTTGIKVFPDFLTSLFLSREQSLVNDVIVLEWEIRLKAALLGRNTIAEVESLASSESSANEGELMFITDQVEKSKKEAAKRDSAQFPKEKALLVDVVKSASQNAVVNMQDGTFTAVGQRNVQKKYLNAEGALNQNEVSNLDTKKSRDAYDKAVNALVKLTGKRKQNFETFDKAKIGVSRNGQTSPASDISKTLSSIGELVSRRSKLLKTLERIIDQNVQIGYVQEDGSWKLATTNFLSSSGFEQSELYSKLIEDDTKHVLGHMSGNRFVIMDEHIISSSFQEKTPEATSVVVHGTEPIVGEGGGNLAGVPAYVAYGVDFDMWRQYGWRAEQTHDKPFLWSAEAQCAPYALMLLSRERKNIVTGSITVMGNEFYQLGDVVYVTHREMLYYVDAIQHEFSHSGKFSTTLKLKYGHPPGEYIPTPLDIIGKNLATKGSAQGAFRIRRDRPGSDTFLGTLQFQKDSTDLLGGPYGKKNFEELKRASLTAKAQINETEPTTSARLYIMFYGSNRGDGEQRSESAANWLLSPYRPEEPGSDISSNLLNPPKIDKDILKYKISKKNVKTDVLNQTVDKKDLTPAEIDLVNKGIVADQKTIFLDGTLENVIELRLRFPPTGGWTN